MLVTPQTYEKNLKGVDNCLKKSLIFRFPYVRNQILCLRTRNSYAQNILWKHRCRCLDAIMQKMWLPIILKIKVWRGGRNLSSSGAALITFLRIPAIIERKSCIQLSGPSRKVWYSLKNMNVPMGVPLGDDKIWLLWASYNIFKRKIMFA